MKKGKTPRRSIVITVFLLALTLLLCTGCGSRATRTPDGTEHNSSSAQKERPRSERAEKDAEERERRKAKWKSARDRIRSGEGMKRSPRTFTEITDPEETPDTIPEPSHVDPDGDAVPNSADAKEQVYRTLCNAIEQRQSVVGVAGVDCDTLKEIVYSIYDIPDYFWLASNNSYSMSSDTSATVYFNWKYDNIDAKKDEIDGKVKQAFQAIPAGADDYEKAVALHDWLCENITYQFSDDGSDQDIYGALGNGLCVCAGYAKAYAYLLNLQGIKADYLTGLGINSAGSGGPHAWNSVVLDDELYYFDVTWDDYDDEYGPRYCWFALSSDVFFDSHERHDNDENPIPSAETSATRCNYYYRNDYVVSSCDDASLLRQFKKQNGDRIRLRFESEDGYTSFLQLIDGDPHFGELLSESGHNANSFYYEWHDAQRCVDIILS